MPGRSNYFLGSNPSTWHTNIPQFARVECRGVYPGVDLAYYGREGALEYDFMLQPGIDPQVIRMQIDADGELLLDDQGTLVIRTRAGDVKLPRPLVYQEQNGKKREVPAHYALRAEREVGFEISSYDHSQPLTIDPVLAYGTYLGGDFGGQGIALDPAGNAYVSGNTHVFSGGILHRTAFVTKLNQDGSAVVYSTYLGGSVDEYHPTIAVDARGNAYVTGSTQSPDFPTVHAIQATIHGSYDAFLTKINPQGSALIYSTYLGGSDSDMSNGIALDSVGNAYIVGSTGSSDFPTANPFQPANAGGGDAFVAKINAAGKSLAYSTYLGGTGLEEATGVAVDSAQNAYITGRTQSGDFPSVNGFQSTNHGADDGFITKFNAQGNAIVYSTYLGGSSEDFPKCIALDSNRNVYVAGTTFSTDFPVVNSFQATNHGQWDGFVTKLSADGRRLVYSTYLGGSQDDLRDSSVMFETESTPALSVDRSGSAYIAGWTLSPDYPAVNALQPTLAGSLDAVITKFTPDGTALVYSTFLGGSGEDVAIGLALDSAGSAYVTGHTYSQNLPTTPAAIVGAPGRDAFVMKIAQQTAVKVSPKTVAFGNLLLGTQSAPSKVTYTNQGAAPLNIANIYLAGASPADYAETNTCPSIVAAGAKCDIWITFTPSHTGGRRSALAISDSDPGSPHAITLLGTGTLVGLAPAQLSFGEQSLNTTSQPLALTLTNTGTSPVTLLGFQFMGLNPGDFSQTNNCGPSVSGGASCTISVRFTPTVLGVRKAVFQVRTKPGSGPPQISLTGTGS